MTDWGSYDSPFGPRTGGSVPALLDKLDAPDARMRARALGDLHRHAVAVGGGYGPPFLPIAGALVPILGERLAAPGALAPQLGQVLEVLGDIAAGNHRLVAASGLPIEALDRVDLGPARATQAAVAELAPAIRARLLDESPAVRAGAAFALAWMPSEAEASVPALLERLGRGGEQNAIARASVLVALGYLGGPADLLREERGAKPPVGVAAAIGAVLADPACLDDDLEALLPEPPKPVVKGFPFLDGALARLRIVVLGGATVRRGDLVAQLALAARLPEKHHAEVATWTVLVAARRPAGALDPLDPEELSQAARDALVERARDADRTPGVADTFRRVGLFSSIPDVQRALGAAPPGPLDERVDGRPLWWWAHALRAGRIDFARWIALLAGRDALAVLEDAAGSAYELYRGREADALYDFAGLSRLLVETKEALHVRSETLEARLTHLAQLQRQVRPPSSVALRAPWP